MVSSKQVPLSDAYWFQEGPGVRNWQFTTSGVKLLNVGNITKDGTIDLDKTDKHISLDEAEGKYSHFLVDEGDLVIASSGISFDEDGMLRTRGAFIEKKHLPLCLNTSTIRFKAIDGVSDLNFFKFWLDSFEFRDQVSRLVTGSAQQNFGPSHLKAINISLPPLTEQKRIASLLARADRLRHLRRTAHDLGESLLQSVFLEMFEKAKGKMKEVRLGTLAEVKTGGTPSREVPEYFDGQIPWVKTTEVINEVIYDTSEKISEAGLKASNCEVFPVDTILLAMYGQGLTRGRTGKLAIPATTNQACAAIQPSSKINTNYLWTFLKLSYNEIRDLGRGGNQPNLNLSMVRDLVIPVPPLSLQEEFAGVVARVESLRGRMSEGERQVEGLFESLLAQSFSN